MTVAEKVAHLKGVMEGMELKGDTKEQKLLLYVSEILEDLARELEELRGDFDDMGDYMEAMDEDLTTLEEEFFEVEDEDEEGPHCGACCRPCDDGEEAFEVTCPHCDNVIVFEEEPQGDAVTCPSCGEEIRLVPEEE